VLVTRLKQDDLFDPMFGEFFSDNYLEITKDAGQDSLLIYFG
jgi:hypothetical protein